MEEEFYIIINRKVTGPLNASEIQKRIQLGSASLLDYFWSEGWTDWKRIADHDHFLGLVPRKPPSSFIRQLQKKIAPKSKKYYLYYKRSQHGPYSKNELVKIIESKKLNSKSYVWIAGWPSWRRITEVTELAPYVLNAPPTSSIRMKTGIGVDTSEKRLVPRRPLVARIFLHNQRDVIIAVCRDISLGGMQVLTDKVPGSVGSTIKLNVSPADVKQVKSFVAEGEIIRLLEDGRGFSLKFIKISDEAKLAIQSYIGEK